MRVSLLAQTILLALITFAQPARPAAHPADSLVDIKEVQRLMASDPDQALSLLEKVKEQKQTPQFKIDWVTYQIYAAKRQYRLGIAFAERGYPEKQGLLPQYVQKLDFRQRRDR